MGKKSKKRKSKLAEDKVKSENDHKVSEAVSKLKHNLPTPSANQACRYTSSELLDKADEFISAFEYGLARKFCQRALEAERDSVRALETYGFLLLQEGNSDEAKHCFGRAIELQPDVGYSKYMYMGQLADGHEAVQFFQTGIDLMKKHHGSEGAKEGAASKESSKEATARDISSAYCAIAEIYLTDACDEENADVKCKENLDLAVEADPTNAEAYHTLASYWLCKGDKQSASQSMDTGVALWLPQLRNAVKPEGASIEDPVEVCPVSYQARISCSKTLIELENYDVASEVLELLLDESDDIVEVWYLLGLLNYLHGSEFQSNARHYLTKGLELASKLDYDDAEMVDQMKQLLAELGPETEAEDEEILEVEEVIEMETESSGEEDDQEQEDGMSAEIDS